VDSSRISRRTGYPPTNGCRGRRQRSKRRAGRSGSPNLGALERRDEVDFPWAGADRVPVGEHDAFPVAKHSPGRHRRGSIHTQPLEWAGPPSRIPCWSAPSGPKVPGVRGRTAVAPPGRSGNPLKENDWQAGEAPTQDGRKPMRAKVGDEIVVKGHHVGEEDRDGVITEVHGENGSPPYAVRWRDGHETVFVPSSDAVVEHRPARRSAG
jgi:hypothetical protein